MSNYPKPPGGHPVQGALMTNRALFTNSYALIPAGVMRDIVTSYLPHWQKSRFWVLARPMTGFAETFSYYIAEVEADGGSDVPDSDEMVQSVIFVTNGAIELIIDGKKYDMSEGGYAFIPCGCAWSLRNNQSSNAVFHWVRKVYEPVDGIDKPEAFVTNEHDITAIEMPDCDGVWSTQRFVDSADLRYDFHVNIVNFKPGGSIPFEETHVMEHGIFVLQGKAAYKLNDDWHEVEAGDFIWLRAFCPQACYAAGPEPFRYLLYKDVNRHAIL